MKKRPVLKLNKGYIFCGIGDWREIVKNIFTDAVYPLNINYEESDDGAADIDQLESLEVVRTWEEWAALPVRPFDDWVNTSRGRIRLPSVVICADYSKIPFHRAKFPTRRNIWERDEYTCGYTLEKLNKNNVSVDHIIPRSKGGRDSWENLVTCKKIINQAKGDLSLDEVKLPDDKDKYGEFAGKKIKLKLKPYKPKFGRDEVVFDNWREEWQHFVEK